MPFLEVQQLSKSFDKQDLPALHRVSFTLEQGQIMGLIGSSGSGKTTLLRIAAGLLDSDQGQVLLDGKRIIGPSEQLVAGHPRIRLLAQAFDLAPKMRVYENLRFFLLKWPKAKQQARIEELLKLCGLTGMAQRFPRELSGGQQQRLALGRALADYPDLLLLDEPFSHLDSHLRHSMRDSLQYLLKDTDTTVVMVTHDPQDALYIAHRAAVLQQGEVIQIGTPQQVYQHPKNIYASRFFGRPNIIATAIVNQWPNSPSYPQHHFCCIREWSVYPSSKNEEGIEATVASIVFITGYYEVALSVHGQLLRMNCTDIGFSVGQSIYICINWAKCQLLVEEMGI